MKATPLLKIIMRLLGAVPTLFGVVLVTFFLTHILPGDPAVFFASNPAMSAADIAQIRSSLGLDQSLLRQLLVYLHNLFQGDLGQSVTTGLPVTTELLNRLPASAELTIIAFILALSIAVPLGLLAACHPHSLIDHLCRLIITIGVAVPVFVSGLLLIFLFYYWLGLAPEPVGRLNPFLFDPPQWSGFLLLDAAIARDGQVFWSALSHIMLPALTMAIFAVAPLARMTRASMLTVLSAEFIRSARANGLSRFQVIGTYAFRNALIPIITTAGMVFSYMLGANVLVERVFAWPGIGAYALNSLLALDYAPLQGFMLLIALIFIIINLLTDIAVAVLDPRAGL